MTQKEIVKVLDRAAGKSMSPATAKQTWFLAGLMSKLNEDADDFTLTGRALSKEIASQLIEGALATLKTREAA